MSDAAIAERYAPPIPAAVRRAAEQADQLARQAIAGAETTTVVVEPSAQPAPPAPAPTVVEPVQQELPLPEPAAPAPAPAAPAPTPTPAADEATLEQRLRTLEGKYNSETKQLRAELRAAQEEASNLRMLMATLQAAPPAQAPSAPPAQADFSEDAETYGSDLIAKAQNWAMAAIAPKLQELQAEVERLRTTSQVTTTKVAQTSVETTLDGAIQNWRDIDTDPAFHAWLDSVDPLSGNPRRGMLQTAYKNGEAARVLAIFRAFLAEHTAVTQPQGHTAPTPPAQPQAGLVPLEELAAPGRPRPGAPAPQNESRIFTHAQIAAFYRDVQQGKYRGREAEQQSTEAEILRAAREGRVR